MFFMESIVNSASFKSTEIPYLLRPPNYTHADVTGRSHSSSLKHASVHTQQTNSNANSCAFLFYNPSSFMAPVLQDRLYHF